MLQLMFKIICIFSFLFCFTMPAMGELDESTRIQKELKRTKQIIKQKKREEKNLINELSKLKKNIHLTQRKLNKVSRTYNNYQNQIKETEQKLNQEEKDLKQTREFLNQKIVSLYKEQNRPVMNLIFQSDSFSTLLNNLYFYEKVIKNDYLELSDAKDRINAFSKMKKDLEHNKIKANSLVKEMSNQRRKLKASQKRNSYILRSLKKDIDKYEEQARVLREESQQLSKFIQKSSVKKEYYGTGSYIRPTGGYISSRFGLRKHPIFKRRKMHNGMDFAAPRGYRIKAADSGYILFSGFKRGYGNVTIINHGWNKKKKKISSLYAHQWKILVRKGQFVKKGQLIGYVGSTGYSTGPHLHFEIRENGTPVNPSQYLRL